MVSFLEGEELAAEKFCRKSSQIRKERLEKSP
jgi:hypothetical protein